MIDPDAVPEEWQVESDRHPQDAAWDDPDHNWDDADQHWDWDVSAGPQPAQVPPPPWYRGPKLLLGLIGLAAATLVVATALLVGGRFSGEIPTSRQLDTRTATATPRSSAATAPTPTSAEPQPTSTTSQSSESATLSATEPPAGVDQPVEPVAPAPPAAAPAPAAPPPKRDEGPRINVTRTPMSFTPSVSARP